MREDNNQDIMIRASNNAHLTKDILMDTWYMKGLMGVYNLGLEHMLSYLEENYDLRRKLTGADFPVDIKKTIEDYKHTLDIVDDILKEL